MAAALGVCGALVFVAFDRVVVVAVAVEDEATAEANEGVFVLEGETADAKDGGEGVDEDGRGGFDLDEATAEANEGDEDVFVLEGETADAKDGGEGEGEGEGEGFDLDGEEEFEGDFPVEEVRDGVGERMEGRGGG